MEKIGWRFPPLSGGTRQGYTNNDIEVFKGQELIDNLAREICQNSLDARKDDSTDPVRVSFELKHIPTESYDVFTDYRNCLDGCRSYWGEEMDSKLKVFLHGAFASLQEKSIPVLVASDYNTRGLSGSHDEKMSSPWEALTGSDGMSVKSERDSGGSYGIGKNAPFACSSLSMVFYNTLDEQHKSAFVGVARLATIHNEKKEPTQRVGKYQTNNDEESVWKPIFPENNCAFRDLFVRNEEGTDVIIAAFNQEHEWVKNVSKAVLKNFFVAIIEGKLTVELIDGDMHLIINASSIGQLYSDYSDTSDMEMYYQLYKAFTTPDTVETLDVLESEDVEVYIKSCAEYRRIVADFRSSGMLVSTYQRRLFQHFSAVVIVRGIQLSELLKDTEPPRHNRWDYKLIPDTEKEKKKIARKAINQIKNEVLHYLKEQFESSSEEIIDAAGVGEYLPDEDDGITGAADGLDALKVKIKIGKVKTIPLKSGDSVVEAQKEEGVAEEGTVHNSDKNPKPLPPRIHPPVPVDPDSLDNEPREGATAGKGTKTVTTANIIAQRVYPVNSSQGLYKIVIKPDKTYEKLFVACAAVGEDGRSDMLEMETLTYNGESVRIDGNNAGPIRVEEDTPAILYAKFRNKEKMRINLQLTEAIK